MRAASASVKAAGAYGREGSRRTTASSATRPVGTCRFRMSALSQRGGAGVASIPKVVGDEAAQDEADGRSLLDEIAREGACRMPVAALESDV